MQSQSVLNKSGTNTVSPEAVKKKRPTAEDIHVEPDYENLVPRPSESEYLALKASLKRDGQRDPIIVNRKGTVLDGHTKFRASQELGMKPLFEVRDFPSKEDEMMFIVDSALIRRNMNDFQKIKAAQIFLKIEKRRAAERRRLGKKQATSTSFEVKVGQASQIVAARIGVSRTTFERGCYIIAQASQKQIRDLEQGLSSINPTYSLLKQRERLKIAEGQPLRETSQKKKDPPAAEDKEKNEGSVKQPKQSLPKMIEPSKTKGMILQECCRCHKSFPVTEMLHICAGCADLVKS